MNQCLIVVLTAAAGATAAPDRSRPAALTDEELKSAYLQCDRLATAAFLDTGDAASCSIIHEELKQRLFGGDFQRLLDWWQAQRTAAVEAQGDIDHERK